MNDDPITESAKAVQETAKATSKGIDALREAGGFFARIFGGSLEQLGGMFEDRLKFRRSVRLVRFAKRYEEICIEEGFSGAVKPVEMKIGVALLEAASLEDNDELQDMYVRLLAVATDPNSTVEARRSFTTILQDFGPLELKLMRLIYTAPEGPFSTIRTGNFPHGYMEGDSMGRLLPDREVQLALWNLSRLACIMSVIALPDANSALGAVSMTELGLALMDACTKPSERVRAAQKTPHGREPVRHEVDQQHT